MTALIEIAGLIRQYTMGTNLVRALNGIDLSIQKGEFVCLMGPSGSGKSTLLNLLGGMDKPDEGQIEVNGLDLAQLDENGLADYRRKFVGFVFQSYNLLPTLTALQNVAFPMFFSDTPRSTRTDRAAALLKALGLGDRMNHKPTELSGGQQQRVAIARSLVNRPVILLGDEPTGNLDSKTGADLLTLLARLNQRGQTLIVVTHDARVADYATRTIHMLDGQIVSEEIHAEQEL